MYKRLLVPIDGSDRTERAVQESLVLARQLGAELVGFVVEPHEALPAAGMHLSSYLRAVDAHEAGCEAHAATLLAHFRAQAQAVGVPFEGHVAHTDEPAVAIAQAAERHGADLVVMVTRGRGALGELFFGSRTKELLALTTRPVLVLH